MLIDFIVGTRPNFIKLSPIIQQLKLKKFKSKIRYRIIHTGQHYDKKLSDVFFTELGITKPSYIIKSGSGTHSTQTSKIMMGYEKYILKNNKPDLCLVFGDVNSTLACSLVAKKAFIKLGHIEAGLRSFDNDMPEEINRIVTDSISDIFFTTSKYANKNLLNSGIKRKKIFFVGNVMIDNLINNLHKFKKPYFWLKYNLKKQNYILLTLHRPVNVDSIKNLLNILNNISKYFNSYKIIFPTHPRTLKKINFQKTLPNILFVDPLPYLNFQFLLKHSFCVITDSGGITEEATFFKIPCLTIRTTTERPETVMIGTNRLIKDIKNISKYDSSMINKIRKKSKIPQFWDGQTSKRILNTILKLFND